MPALHEFLEPQLKGKLDRARIIHSLIDRLTHHPKTARRINVLLSGAGYARQKEMRMIKEIEELRPEIQPHVLPGKREMLDQ